jgi:hypothetical protein
MTAGTASRKGALHMAPFEETPDERLLAIAGAEGGIAGAPNSAAYRILHVAGQITRPPGAPLCILEWHLFRGLSRALVASSCLWV